MTLRSSLYSGWVTHNRCAPRQHSFRYRVWWMLVDLDELPDIGRSVRVFSYNRSNLFALHDTDYGHGRTDLRADVAGRLEAAGLAHAGVRIELLTMPRLCGYAFNPLSIYFCRDVEGRLAAIVYEVHNTFGERHSYVIEAAEDASGIVHQASGKAFYVSPFMDMSQDYRFRVNGPGGSVAVAITGAQNGTPVIHTKLYGTRSPLSSTALLRLWICHPLLMLKVIGAIHWEAFRIWRKGIPVRPRESVTGHAATLGHPAKPVQGDHG